MVREMRDALYPTKIPTGIDQSIIIAAYTDNRDNPSSYRDALVRFPGHLVVAISTEARLWANILDVERGATDPTDRVDIVRWVTERRAQGGTPYIYATDTNYNMCLTYFPPGECPLQWQAAWNGDPSIKPGTIGHQYANSNSAIPPGAYDTSAMIDFIEGIDDMALTDDDLNKIFNVVWARNMPAHNPVLGDVTDSQMFTVLASIFDNITALTGLVKALDPAATPTGPDITALSAGIKALPLASVKALETDLAAFIASQGV